MEDKQKKEIEERRIFKEMERKQYNGEFKARVAIEAIKGEKTAMR